LQISLEMVDHLFLHCPFVREVWAFSRDLLPSLWDWHGNTFELALQAWLHGHRQEDFWAFPFILAWGIWITRNGHIFQDENFSSRKGCCQMLWDLQFLLGFGWGHIVAQPRVVREESPDLVSHGHILMALPCLIRQNVVGVDAFISQKHITLPSKRGWGMAQTTTLNLWL
jgi:hypothetical protein